MFYLDQLSKSYYFHQFSVDHANIGIHAIDADGYTQIYNDKMGLIEGLEPKTVLNRKMEDLISFKNSESTLLKVLQSGEALHNIEQTYWNQNGDEITTVNTTLPLIDEGKIVGAVEYATDISFYKKHVLQPLKKHAYSKTFNKVIAQSQAMKNVLSHAQKAAEARLPVLLVGETGTGKDLIAERIHISLEPKNHSFFTLLCQVVDERWLDQIALELSNSTKMTLFCERIDLLPIHLQDKLLHLLELNSAKQHLLIASVDDDPVELIANGKLLKELYYFFSTITIQIPPLYERTDDIQPFIQAFFEEQHEKYGISIPTIDSKVLDLMNDYRWPGNIRELQHLLEEIVTRDKHIQVITDDLLPIHFLMKHEKEESALFEVTQDKKEPKSLEQFLFEAEKYYVEKALKENDQNITRAAKDLQMSRQNLQYRIRKFKKNEA